MIQISRENNVKRVNGRTLDEILENFEVKDFEHNAIKRIFEKIESEEGLILELKKVKKETTPVSLLLIIKALANVSLRDAYTIFDPVMLDE